MKLICGTIVVRRKVKRGKEDKVSHILENVFASYSNLCSNFKPFPCCLSCSTSLWMLLNWIVRTSVYLGKPLLKNFAVGSQSHGSLLVVNLNFRWLWYGGKSSKSLWSCSSQVLGTLNTFKLPGMIWFIALSTSFGFQNPYDK